MINTPPQTFEIAQWNARGFRNHIQEFYDFMSEQHIQLACISETNFNINDIVPSHPNFIMYRLDRTTSQTRSGGVAIIVSRNIIHELLPAPKTNLIEAIGVKIKLQNGSTADFFSIYVPGTNNYSLVNLHYKNDLHLLTNNSNSFFIAGDFNSRHQFWNCLSSNLSGRILYNLQQNQPFLIHHPNTPTYVSSSSNRNDSTIDLVLTNGLHHISNSTCFPSSSDHNIVRHDIELSEPRIPHQLRKIPSFKNADWLRYQRIVDGKLREMNLTEDLILSSRDEIDTHINSLNEILLDAQLQAVPSVSPNAYNIVLTPEIKDKMTQRNDLVRQSQRNRHLRPILRTEINFLNDSISDDISKLENENFNNMLSTITNDNHNHQMWQLTRFLKNRHKFIPPLKVDDDTLITPLEKSNALANQFKNNHENPLSTNNISHTRHVNRSVNDFMSGTEISDVELTNTTELNEIARRLKNPKAPGFDRVNNRLIKKLPPIGFVYLAIIINSCLSHAYFPEAWKHAKMIPIRKPGKPPQSPSSYRPISLLSSLSKMLERVLLKRLNNHLTNNNIIPPQQHGFRLFHSTSTQLHRITSHIKSALSGRLSLSTGLVSLDIQKAFDCVWHNGLIYKLIHMKNPITNTAAPVPTYLVKIVHSFLENRSFQVCINNTLSESHQIQYGTPQGSVLSPVLYNIYTHDIPLDPHCHLALYADDTAIYSSSRFAKQITNRLETYLSRIKKYYTKWKLTLNDDKTQVMFFTKRRTRQLPQRPFQVKSGGTTTDIEWSENLRYLGVIFDKTLTYKDHIQHVLKRTHTATKILYSLFNRKSRLNINNKILLYKAALRPIFTYALPAIPTIASSHIKKLQICQNKLIKTAMNVPWFTRTATIHQDNKIEMINEFQDKLIMNFNNRLEFLSN